MLRTGRIDSQRGLLNREALELPKFLSLEKETDSGDFPSRIRLNSFGDDSENFDSFDGRLPTASQAYALFGGGTKGFPKSSFVEGESGQISKLDSLFTNCPQNDNNELFEPPSFDSSDNLDYPASFESLTGIFHFCNVYKIFFNTAVNKINMFF